MLSSISNLSCKYRRASFFLRGKRVICYTEHCFGRLVSSLSCNTSHDLSFQIQQNEESAQPPWLSQRNIKAQWEMTLRPTLAVQFYHWQRICAIVRLHLQLLTRPEMSSSAGSWDGPFSAHHCFFRRCLCVSNLWQPQAKANESVTNILHCLLWRTWLKPVYLLKVCFIFIYLSIKKKPSIIWCQDTRLHWQFMKYRGKGRKIRKNQTSSRRGKIWFPVYRANSDWGRK